MRRAREAPSKHEPLPHHPYVAWLAEAVGAAAPGTRTLVLTPSAESAAALRTATLHACGVLLGVRFVTSVPLLREILWSLGEPTADDLLLPLEERALLREILRADPGDVAAYALRHRPSLAALHGACREWARAGSPEPATRIPAWAAGTLAIARRFGDTLHAHARPSRAQLVRRALDALAAERRPRTKLRILSLDPGCAKDVVSVLDALRDRGGAEVEVAPAAETRPSGFTRSAHPHVEAELRAAAHRCALAYGAGTPLDAMVVAAPRLGPYLPYLAEAFAAEGLPVCAAAETPLTHEPRGALATHALTLLFDGAPARTWLALLGSPLARRPLPPAAHGILERAAREHGLCGVDALATRVATHLADVAPEAAAGVRRLADHIAHASTATTAAAKAQAIAALLAAEVEPPLADTRDAQAKHRLDEVLRELHAADPEAFVADARELLASRGLPVGERGTASVHVVEFDAAAAFPAARVELLGFADDQIPASGGGTTFFDEAARTTFGLGARADARAAEHACVVRLAHLATRHLHVSRATADAQGRPVGPTALLEAVAEGLPACEERLESNHPGARAAARVASGILPVDFAIAHAGLREATLAATSLLLGARAGRLRRRAAALEDFGGGLAHDGDVGADLAATHVARILSVSDLQTLARCPLQHMFRRVLDLRPLPPEPDALSLAPNALGTVVHELLAELGPRLGSASAAAQPPDVAALAAELAPVLDARLAARAPLVHTLPALHRILVRQWARAIAVGFVDDARDLRTRAITPLHHEREIVGDLDIGHEAPLRVRGVVDRIDAMHDGGLRVIDYKTGRNPDLANNPYEILRGRQLQMPIYAMLTAQALRARATELGVRAVRPDWHTHEELWHVWRRAADFLAGSMRDDLLDTLRRLAVLRASGTFVPSMDRENACRFCDYRAACHRLHPPSRERVTSSARSEVAAYFQLRQKKPITRRGGADAS